VILSYDVNDIRNHCVNKIVVKTQFTILVKPREYKYLDIFAIQMRLT
jgi:hypothetical protein